VPNVGKTLRSSSTQPRAAAGDCCREGQRLGRAGGGVCRTKAV